MTDPPNRSRFNSEVLLPLLPSPVTVRGLTQEPKTMNETHAALAATPYQPRYPLVEKHTTHSWNYHGWLTVWHMLSDADALVGMLHVLFTKQIAKAHEAEPEYGYHDPILLCLALAEGWTNNGYLLKKDGDERLTYRLPGHLSDDKLKVEPYKWRQPVAQKAFAVLITHLNAIIEHGHPLSHVFTGYNAVFEQLIMREDVFAALRQLFRIEVTKHSRYIQHCSTGFNSQNETARVLIKSTESFLYRLMNFLWNWREHKVPNHNPPSDYSTGVERLNTRMRKLIDEARPWMVQVIFVLDKQDELDRWMMDRGEHELDARTAQVLVDIAMETRCVPTGGDKRVPRNFREALAAGASAAVLLRTARHRHRLKMPANRPPIA